MPNETPAGGAGKVVPIEQAPGTTKQLQKKYCATLLPGPTVELDAAFAECILQMETAIKMPIWLFIQNGDEQYSTIDADVYKLFLTARHQIETDVPICMLIESSGGYTDFAYRIARLFQRRNKQFHVLIAQYAKSGATLMALAAKSIIMCQDSELGPLDVQVYDKEHETFDSALNAVQSLERLNAFALTALDQAMLLLVPRMAKKADTLLPTALSYATNIVSPLMAKIDTIDITKKSRELKVAEEYALRLMKVNYSATEAKYTAQRLIEKYPTHGFVIDSTEAAAKGSAQGQGGLGLKVAQCTPELEKLLDRLMPFLDNGTFFGRVKEIQ